MQFVYSEIYSYKIQMRILYENEPEMTVSPIPGYYSEFNLNLLYV